MSLNGLLQERAALAVPPVPSENQPQGTGKHLANQGGSPGSLISPENHEKAGGTDAGRDVASRQQNENEGQRRTIHFQESEGTREPDPLLAETQARRLWTITRPDGSRFSLSRNPPATLAEIQRDYVGCIVEPEREPSDIGRLTPDDLTMAHALLRHWGEDDSETRREWMNGLRADPTRLEGMRQMARQLTERDAA